MEKKTTGLMVVATNLLDPTQETEFHKWYNEVHIPHVLKGGAFSSAARFVNTYEGTKSGSSKYLAIYETDWKDPVEAWKHQFTYRDQEPYRFGKYESTMVAVFRRIPPIA